MISRRYRFYGLGSVRPAMKYGQRLRGPGLALAYVRVKGGGPRFAVIVSKKVSKKATHRNRIRRRIYEALRLQQTGFIAGTDVVINVFDATIADRDWQQLNAQLKALLQKAGVVS